MILVLYEFMFLPPMLFPESSVERLVLPPLLSIMSFIPWQGAHEEPVGIVALTHSGTTREERLKPSGCGGGG